MRRVRAECAPGKRSQMCLCSKCPVFFWAIFLGPQEGKICVAILIFPHYRDPSEGKGYIATLILPHYVDPWESKGDVAILINPHYGDPETARSDVAIWIFPQHGYPEKAGVMAVRRIDCECSSAVHVRQGSRNKTCSP